MTPQDTQLYAPVLVGIVVILLLGRRLVRPRRFRLATLWIGPAVILAGIASFLSSQPLPTPAHGLALAAAGLGGGALGWLRAKLVKMEFDPATGAITQRGTPYGLILLVALFVLRAGVRIATAQHPEWGINLNRATDLFLFFAFGIVAGYAVELHLAAGRARQAAGSPQV